jgi:hypothetical protein
MLISYGHQWYLPCVQNRLMGKEHNGAEVLADTFEVLWNTPAKKNAIPLAG